MMPYLLSLMVLLTSTFLLAMGAEHHLLLCDNSPKEVMQAFHVQPDKKSRTEVFYFDGVHRQLFSSGVILRVRFTHSAKAQVDVKLRPIVLQKIPQKWQNHKSLKCEYDVKPDRRQGACRLRNELDAKVAMKLIRSGQYSGLMSAEQIRFLKDIKGLSIPWREIRFYGPTRIDSWSSNRFAFELAIVQLRNSAMLAEISTRKKNYREPFAEGLVALARDKNMRVCREQDSKTKRILSSFFDRHRLR